MLVLSLSGFDLRKSHPKMPERALLVGFQGNNVGRIGLDCKF